MARSILLWILAFVITASSAVYQRITGPTYAKKGSFTIENVEIKYRLDRTHAGEGGQEAKITIPDESVTGILFWKRLKTQDDWTAVEMTRAGEELTAEMPHQPPAGKLQYYLKFKKADTEYTIPENEFIITRFRGDVPIIVILPHVLFIFGAMLLSMRAGLQVIVKGENLYKYTLWTIVFMFIGGFILGPIMQKLSFGAFWTGFPFGIDLTDNKTLIAFIFWLIAWYKGRGGKDAGKWVLTASLVTLIIFLIPHSVLGSELDYSKIPAE